MSIYHNRSGLSRRFRLILTSFLQGEGLPFADVLPEKRIEEAFADQDAEFAEEEDCIYTPAITLWAFLSQVLFKDEQRSCLAAVSRVLVLLVALGREPCEKNSGAYCRARAKLSEPVIRHLTREVAEGCESAVPGKWLWHGRHVLLADGTTASMPDTAENQAEYPQHVAQKPGLGFPIVRLVVLLSLATAMVRDMALGPYRQRWLAELDIRTIKQTMGMDVLRCKSPAMVRKEIWTCLLAYNLVRKTMLQSACAADLSPRNLSFTTAMQTIAASLGMLAWADEELATRLMAAQLASLAEQTVGDRPNRVEPRAVKRRPQPLALLTKPRDEARAELLRGTHT